MGRDKDPEGRGLGAAAPQNAPSARTERHRAKDELVKAKEALERRTSELAHSLALMRAALDSTAEGIVATNIAGRITGYNRKFLEMWRLPQEVVESGEHQNVIDAVNLQIAEPDAFRARLAEIDQKGLPDSFDVLHLADGRVFERVSKVQLVGGQNVGRVWSFRDVTERVLAQEQLHQLNESLEERVRERTDALRQSEQQFLQLVLGVTDCAIYMLNPEGYVSTWNPGAERIKGYSRDEILGKHFSIFYAEEDRAKGLPNLVLEKAVREGKYEAEAWRVRKDGSRFWASVLVDPIYDKQGNLSGFAKITRDMTDRRAMQEQLHQSQKMEAIGQLTGGVAHDFNNLLTVILGNLETLARQIPATDGRLRRAVDQAARGAHRAATLTQQLLAFSRRQPLNPKPTDVNRLVTGMSDLIRRTLTERVSIETVLGAGVWRTEVDPHQLESALLNLAVNARDAMPEGGKLTIETANAHLDDVYTAKYAEIEPGQYVVICVSDTGTGMPKDVLVRAFDPFFTTKPIGEGTGLGLSQVYGFVKQSGGHLKLYSEPGEGTTVKIYLPRYVGSFEDDVREILPSVPQGSSNEVILVVEDDDDVRSYSTDSLRELGFTVLEAPDGPSALQLLEGHPEVNMLFTDVGLPGLNGRELVDLARRRQPDLKVLFTSGYARNAIVHQNRLDQGVELLTKPFTRAQLASRVRDVLDARTPPALKRTTGMALVVEDEPLVCMYLAQTLEQLGLNVHETRSVAQALAFADSNEEISVAFIDIGLPDGNGLALAEQFRSKWPSVRIVIASGYGERALQDTRADEGVSFVSKPYDTDAIKATLRQLGLIEPH